MTFEESLQDVAIRERQLEAHLLRSREYLRQADRELKRQVSVLYLAIALLLVFQGFFSFHAVSEIPFNFSFTALMTATSLLAIINCALLIRTKTWLHRLNEAWLRPEERIALDTVRNQRYAILTRLPRASQTGDETAELN